MVLSIMLINMTCKTGKNERLFIRLVHESFPNYRELDSVAVILVCTSELSY